MIAVISGDVHYMGELTELELSRHLGIPVCVFNATSEYKPLLYDTKTGFFSGDLPILNDDILMFNAVDNNSKRGSVIFQVNYKSEGLIELRAIK